MNQQLEEDQARYILFVIGGELYGTPLLGVREVVETQPIKIIPNTVPYFAGVINVRGEIIGVLDLRLRFGSQASNDPHQALLIFDTVNGAMAGLVDRVEAVVKMGEEQIEHSPNIKTTAPLKYLIGIGRWGERLVTLIDLRQILGHEEIAAVRSTLT
jgi:purine-binding chemotaxis protein CheW